MGLAESLKRVADMDSCPPLTGTFSGLGGLGVVVVADDVKSLNYFLHMPFVTAAERTRRKLTLMNEFVWDPINIRFATIIRGIKLHGSPHETLARAINADENHVCGGIIRYPDTPDGVTRSLSTLEKIVTCEFSGHYHMNWTPEIRYQYVKYMRMRTGLPVEHSEGM